jgi:methionyl-tRNA synthetase
MKDPITFDAFAKLDLRVATIEQAEAHPNADRLLKLQLDLGPDLGKRQICAGIRAFYAPDELVGKQVIVVANLEPRTIRGEPSNGMLLAASAEDAGQITDVVVLAPVRPTPPGSTVG